LSTIKVPLLDLKAQYVSIKDEVNAAIQSVLESQVFILGPEVAALEDEVSKYSNVPHAIGCASGSDALVLALLALDVKPGDEILCPSYTFFATAGAVARLGATPVFVDIEPVSYNMDPAALRSAAGRCKRLKAIIPVHLFGQCANMVEIEKIAHDLGVPIIEDAAQAIGSEDVRGKRAGSMGVLGCYSFFPSKNLGGFGDGGMNSSLDGNLAEKMRVLRVHGSKPKYFHKVIGFNSRLDALQAAILRVKLRHLDKWTQGRQKNAAFYDQAFAKIGAKTTMTPLSEENGLPLRTPAPVPSGARHIYNQYVLRVPAKLRDPLINHLKEQNIGTEVYYPLPLHLQECFAYLNCKAGTLPQSESAAKETLALPVYPEMSTQQLDYVAEKVTEFLSRYGLAASLFSNLRSSKWDGLARARKS